MTDPTKDELAGPRDSSPVLDTPFASVTDLPPPEDPTEPIPAGELRALLASSRPPPPPLESDLLDDVPDEEPTRPSTPDAKRRNTPFPR